jgi:hypothetical protein
MNQRIIYPNDDGGVSIVIPAPEVRKQVLVSEAVTETVIVPATEDNPEHEQTNIITPAVYRDETDQEFAEWIAAKDVPEGKPFKIVDVADIPSDRTFRNAWEYQE